jgi:hypothetical protein
MKMTEAQVRKHLAQNNSQKSGLDALDLEAEREGSARRFFRTNSIGPEQLGRRISKDSRKADGLQKSAEYKATAYIVAETARILREHTAPAR